MPPSRDIQLHVHVITQDKRCRPNALSLRSFDFGVFMIKFIGTNSFSCVNIWGGGNMFQLNYIVLKWKYLQIINEKVYASVYI